MGDHLCLVFNPDCWRCQLNEDELYGAELLDDQHAVALDYDFEAERSQ